MQIRNFSIKICISFTKQTYYICTVVMKQPALIRLHIEKIICNSISLFGGIKPKIETTFYSQNQIFIL